MIPARLLTAVAATFVLTVATAAHAQLTFTEVVRRGDTVPGAGGQFTSFRAPSIDGNDVVYQGFSDGNSGIFGVLNGTPTRIADESITAPGNPSPFTSFREFVTISDGVVMFIGDGPGPIIQGVYAYNNGSLSTIANDGTQDPFGAGNLNAGGSDPISNVGNSIAIEVVDGDGNNAIYTSINGTLAEVVDTTAPAPGGVGNFGSFDEPQINANGKVVFEADDSNSNDGIYTNITGPITKVVDVNDAVPGGTGNFTSLNDPTIDGNDIVFVGNDSSSNTGIYGVFNGGPITKLVDKNDAAPGGTGNFTSFSFNSVVYRDGIVVFRGFDGNGVSGLYFLDVLGGGSLTQIIAAGDQINGETVDSISFLRSGFDGRNIAFVANFDAIDRAIFTATIPEPASLALLGLGGLALMRRRNALR